MMKALRENKMDIFDLYQGGGPQGPHILGGKQRKLGRCSPQCRWILRFLSISSGSAQNNKEKKWKHPSVGLNVVVRRQFAGAFYVKIDQRNWINSYDHIVKSI